MLNLTKEILDLSEGARLPEIVTNDPRVTSVSRWSTDRWVMDGRTPGYPAFGIAWFPEETKPKILDELKLLAACLFLPRGAFRPLKHSSAPHFSIAARYLAGFMAEKGYASLSDLDDAAFDLFKKYIKRSVSKVETKLDAGETPTAENPSGEDNGSEEIDGDTPPDPEASAPGDVEVDRRSRHFVVLRLRIWKHLHWMRADMNAAGVQVRLGDMFRNLPLWKLTEELARDGLSDMEDLPDEVVLPILTEAHRLIGEPAEQVIALVRDYMAIRPLAKSDVAYKRVRAERLALLAGQSLVIEGEQQPWFTLPTGADVDPTHVVLELVKLIRDACVVTLAAGIGWRVSEASSVEVEPRDTFEELPSCILVTPSFTRTSDHFWVRGLLSKHRPEPTPEDWLIGARLRGSTAEPITVRAIRVLERLLYPWRSMSRSPVLQRQLLVDWWGAGVTFSPRNVVRVKNDALRRAARAFIVERVKLGERLAPLVASKPELATYAEGDGDCIRPHQWRRTFFRMMYRIDSNLLPALSRHFKHISLAVTENGYAPKSPAALEDAEAVATGELVELLYTRGEGGPPAVTGGDRILQRHRDVISSIIDGEDVADAAPRLAEFAAHRNLRLWPAEHGSCLIGLNPDKAACQVRHGRIDWRVEEPNLSRRNPGLCCSCPNLVVTLRDEPFWQRRYRTNRKAWLQSGRDPSFRFARDRARQARTILEQIGATIPDDTTEEGEKA